MYLQLLAYAIIVVYDGEKKGVIYMANTNAVYARIDSTLKENAENILGKLGISPSSAIQMLYSQIVLQNGMPFELRLSNRKTPVSLSRLSKEELDAELQKGIDSLKNDKSYSIDEVDALLAKEYGI
jgi:hypothetical protein